MQNVIRRITVSDNNTVAVHIYCNIGKRNCGHETAVFQSIIWYNFEFPEAWVASYFKTGPLFVGVTWLVIIICEGKETCGS